MEMAFQNFTNSRGLPTYAMGSLIYPEDSILQTIPDFQFGNANYLAQPKALAIDNKREVYKKLVEEVVSKMQETQRENERCVLRINMVKRMIRQRARDVALLKRRLDRYNDSWRTAPIISPHPKRKIERKRGPKPKPKPPPAENKPIKEKKVSKPRAKKAAIANNSSNAKPNNSEFAIPTYLPPVIRFSKSDILNCDLEESLHAGAEIRILDGQILRVI